VNGWAGGGTRPEHRGRGAYRALVRARWDAAVERGTPILTVGAGAMSRPILERLGFTIVGWEDCLLDPLGLTFASSRPRFLCREALQASDKGSAAGGRDQFRHAQLLQLLRAALDDDT